MRAPFHPLNCRWAALGVLAGVALGCSEPPAQDDAANAENHGGEDLTTSPTTDVAGATTTPCALQVGLPRVSSECVVIAGEVYSWAHSSENGRSSVDEPWVSDESLCYSGHAGYQISGLVEWTSETWAYGAGLGIMLSQWEGGTEDQSLAPEEQVVLFDASAHGFDGVRFTLAEAPHLENLKLEITADGPEAGEHQHYRDMEQVLHAGVNEVRFDGYYLSGDSRAAPFNPYSIDLIQWNMVPPPNGGFDFTVCISDIELFSDAE